MLEDGAWFHVEGGDGFEGVIHPEDESIMYCLTQYGGIRKSVNGGSSFDASTNGITENGAWDTPFMMSPINPSTLYSKQ